MNYDLLFVMYKILNKYSYVRFHLESSFLTHAQEAINEADIIGVMHDSSNEYTRHRLDSKILRLLLVNPEKDSFLILNKVRNIFGFLNFDLSTVIIFILSYLCNDRFIYYTYGNSLMYYIIC